MSKTHWVLDATFAGRGITSIGSKWKFSMIPVLPIPASKPILLVRKDWFWWHRLCTATKNAYLAQIISPEIKLSTEAIFYYKRFESTDSQFSNCDISESKRARQDPLVPKWPQRAGLSHALSPFGVKTFSDFSENVTTTCSWDPSLMPKKITFTPTKINSQSLEDTQVRNISQKNSFDKYTLGRAFNLNFKPSYTFLNIQAFIYIFEHLSLHIHFENLSLHIHFRAFKPSYTFSSI